MSHSYRPTLAEAIHYTKHAILELYANDGMAEVGAELLTHEQIGANGKMDAIYRQLSTYPRTDPVDLKQYAKGLMMNFLGEHCPSDEPFTPNGHSALDVQASFAIAAANAEPY